MILQELQHEVEASREAGRLPRVHPNGFIQLDLNEALSRRLHIWDKSVPRQSVYTPIHNHEFAFTSTVLRGMLRNVIYRLIESDANPHVAWHVQRRLDTPETTLLPSAGIVTPVLSRIQTIAAGEGYEFPEGAFHESTFEDHTVSVIEKAPKNPNISAAVLVPAGQEPDNTFIRGGFDTAKLWTLIEQSLDH